MCLCGLASFIHGLVSFYEFVNLVILIRWTCHPLDLGGFFCVKKFK